MAAPVGFAATSITQGTRDDHSPITIEQKPEDLVILQTVPISPTDSTLSSPSTTAPLIPNSPPCGRLNRLKAALHHRRKQRSEPVWRTSVFQVRPLLGLTALGVTVGCMFLSLAILLASHNQPTRTWAVQPTVYLAIAAALANVSLAFARQIALPIAWWHTVSRGTTIADLERQWEVGHTLVLALRHHVRMGFTGFATILVAIMIIDGPLLQRSVTVQMATHTKEVTLALNLAPEVPTAFCGYWFANGLTPSDVSAQVSTQWAEKAPIVLDVQRCNGTCATTLRAPGTTELNCSSQTWPISNEMYHDSNATWGSFYHGWDDSYHATTNPLFSIKVVYRTTKVRPNSSVVAIGTGVLSIHQSDDGTLTGEYVYNACYYLPAILEYDVFITGKEVMIPDSPNQGRLVSVANNTRGPWEADPEVYWPSTIDHFTAYLNLFVGVNVSVVYLGLNGPDNFWREDPRIATNGAVLGKYLDATAVNDVKFADPSHDVIAQMNEMMFRAGVAASGWDNLTSLIDPGLAVQQTLQANQTTTEDVYNSDMRWFAGAAALELFAVLMVLPLFWGWWTIGRTNVLSPVELALAFDAPLFRDANSAQGVRKAVQKVGTTKVRYGAVGSTTPYRLGIAECQNVSTPHQGMRFDA
ncbi:hypothetical protein LTR56_026366 [Elasticomyces elasticus]|nr:hypothetical protein LTR56_026366 [Elasticomyces elasticus]KAK3625756.1 hypothetical protein LTR22_023410 [Elasticomyces elasticus]KAK4903667.1 hypothetical protein LTR49_026739 [Elasticomyces elasticus]KAK5746539.1 hypothetical protein LTS12_022722 [Elasticomyces elasticus]